VDRSERPQPPGSKSNETVIVGIDPGLRITGYGVLRLVGADVSLIRIGVIRPKGGTAERLAAIYGGIRDVIRESGAREVAIEQPFVAMNTKSAFAIGEARAAAILAAAHEQTEVYEYMPTAVKQAVAGYGRGSKEQIGEMVRLQFGLPSVPSPPDASDAAAVALCHVAHRRTAQLVRSRR
jgi:crossover junction endodeoxyribonuclease RuvC